jgi:hypothetical protein
VTLVNGLVWASSTGPLRLVQRLVFPGPCEEALVGGDDDDVVVFGGSHDGMVSSSFRIRPCVNVLRNVARFVTLSVYFSPLLFLSVPCMVFGVRRDVWVRLLRLTLSVGGPAFIKWGQWAATRHDMFPRDVCRELERLHSDAPAHPFKHTEREVEASFGFRLEDLFERFERVPVARYGYSEFNNGNDSNLLLAHFGFARYGSV